MAIDLQSIMDRYRQAREDPGTTVLAHRQVRDLTVITISEDFLLVVAADSDGAIGPKPGDAVHVSGIEAGRFAVRVPLMEILACGAVPIAAFDCLSVEMIPTGRTIIEGVRMELRSTGLPESFPLSGSTEDNVPTTQTGIGVTVLGLVHVSDFRPGTSRADDLLLCLGTPKSGPTDVVTINDAAIADGALVAKARRVEGVHDILPVGSKGILYEAEQMAQTSGLTLNMKPEAAVDLGKSAGPSTCVLVSATPGSLAVLQASLSVPVHQIGKLVRAR